MGAVKWKREEQRQISGGAEEKLIFLAVAEGATTGYLPNKRFNIITAPIK